MLNVFRNIQLLFLISVIFWKTFQHDKNHKLLIMFTLHFGFGQLFCFVEKFSCQKVCTIQKKDVPLHSISR